MRRNVAGTVVSTVIGIARGIGRLAALDLLRTVKDRPAAVWMLVMPLAFMWFFGNMSYGGSGAPKVSLAVVDHDGGWLARALVAELEADGVALQRLTPEEAASLEEAPVRTLHLPQGLTAGVAAGEPQTLVIERSPDAAEDFSMAAEAHVLRVVVRTLGRLVEIAPQGELPASGDGGAIAERFAALGRREPLVRLEVRTAGSGRPVPSGRAQSVPGMLTMMVLMMTLTYGGVFLTSEKREGMLRRQAALPLARGSLVAGKLLGRVLVAGVQTGVLLAAGRFVMGVSYGTSASGLLWLSGCYVLAVGAMATFLGAVLQTPEQASAVGWITGMVLAGLGGCWWPSELMPRWLWQAAHVLPTAWAMDGFHALISFGRGFAGVLLPGAALLGFALLFTVLATRWLRFE